MFDGNAGWRRSPTRLPPATQDNERTSLCAAALIPAAARISAGTEYDKVYSAFTMPAARGFPRAKRHTPRVTSTAAHVWGRHMYPVEGHAAAEDTEKSGEGRSRVPGDDGGEDTIRRGSGHG